MDLDAYVAEHSGEWRRLDDLTRRRVLTAAEVDEMVLLYQRTATHLSLIRSRSTDPVLVARLSRLVLTARAAITGSTPMRWRTVARFFTATFPAAVYRCWPWWTGVMVACTVVTGALMVYVAGHLEVATRVLDDQQIQELVEHDFETYYSSNAAQNFALQVWLNNALLTGLVLVGGVLVLPTLYVLWNNAANIALVGGVMIAYGRADLFFGLIAPHGLLELTAVFVGAGVGLRTGWSWLVPGPHRTRTRALAESARASVVVALGLAVVLLVSGIIEAFVTPSPLPPSVRIAIGVLAWVAFLAYIVVLGRRAVDEGETGDLAPELSAATAPTAPHA